MIALRQILPASLVLLAAVFLAGCGSGTDGPQRHRLSGSVTFNGQPVPAGQVVFDPDTSAGNSGPQGYATIVDGRYDTEDKGPVSGPQQVLISGYDSLSTDENHPSKPLFENYRTQVDPAQAGGTLDFDVPASAATPAGQPTSRPAPVGP